MRSVSPARIGLDFMVGLLAVMCLGMVGAGLSVLYEKVGMWVVATPVVILAITAAGHVIHGMMDSDNRRSCLGCGNYTYSNVFTEWYHSRRCLVGIVKKVG